MPASTIKTRRSPATAKPITRKKDTVMTTIDAGKATFAEATQHAETAFAKGQQLFGDIGEFNKGNLEAMVESSKIAAKGLEAFGKDAATFVKTSFDEAQGQARALAAAASPTEFLKLHGDFTRVAFDRIVAETSRGTEAMLKLAGEIAQPLSNRVALAAEKVKLAA